MLSRNGVDALCIFHGQLVKDLDLSSDEPVAFGVGVADGAAGAFGCDRLSNILLRSSDHGPQVLVKPGISGLYVRCVFDK